MNINSLFILYSNININENIHKYPENEYKMKYFFEQTTV